MTHVQLVAASLAAGTTLALLSAVVSMAEPQRGVLQARLHVPQAKASPVAAGNTQPVPQPPHEVPAAREDM
jgi:hypothetical protein